MNTTDSIERVINRINHLMRKHGLKEPRCKVEVSSYTSCKFCIWAHNDSMQIIPHAYSSTLKAAYKDVVQQLNDLAKSKESKT